MASSNQPYPYSGNETKLSPPSPSLSSPGLTQSTSNSSGSPPPPSTPPRRQKHRQSDQGRVPLHRRGTSRTYENLEDLLREAGYKETRIFTPESDRIEPHARDGEDGQTAGKAQGVRAAVVGFLTGLVSGHGNSTATSQLGQESDEQRPRLFRTQSPLSPLTDRPQVSSYFQENAPNAESIEPQTSYMTSSNESLGGPTSKARRPQTSWHRQDRILSQPSTPNSPEERSYPPTSGYQTCSDLNHTQNMSRFSHLHQHRHHHHHTPAAPSRIQNQGSWSSITTSSNNNVISLNSSNDAGTPTSNNSTVVINDPMPSRAGTYLRHVISVPTIAPPPPHSIPRNASTNGPEGGPALPRKWFDSVARVLTLGVATTSCTNSTPTPSGQSDSPTPITSPSPQAPACSSYLPRPSSFYHPHPQYQHRRPLQHNRTLRPSRSSLSQTTYRSAFSASTTTTRPQLVLGDQTNSGALTPPVFLTRFERERAPCSQSQVSRARVYCRSAPASRAPSPSRYNQNRSRKSNNKQQDLRDYNGGGRSGGSGALGKRAARDGGGGSRKRTNRRKKGDEENTRVPSLAKTRVEGDDWHKRSGKGRRRGDSDNNDDPFSPNDGHHQHQHQHQHHRHHHHHNQLLKPRASHSGNDDDGDGGEFYETEEDEDYDEDEEDEEEGELDLAKMLVNPKRQQSIRSLRKHLHHSQRHQLLTSPPTAFVDSLNSKSGVTSSSSNATHPDHNTNTTNTNNSNSNNGNNSITHPSLSRPHAPANQQRRLASSIRQTVQGNEDTAGQWERQWRSGELTSSRRGSEDDDLYESLTWLNDDKDDDSKKNNNGAKARLGVPRPWTSNSASQGSR